MRNGIRTDQRYWPLALAALFACFLDLTAAAHATKPLPRVTISGRVLFGQAKSFRAVGTVDRRAVFDAIPAIKTLRAERVGPNSARYHFLIYEANREFQRAIATVALLRSVDLVVEVGGVAAAGIDVHDLTAPLVAAVAGSVKR
ncbi:MAG: hypothetical protein EXS13_03245 [Planctomycetes bacterium]|nr:hypothetical protein [Planctomycetota bacterium]